jgi:hypothetical protein
MMEIPLKLVVMLVKHVLLPLKPVLLGSLELTVISVIRTLSLAMAHGLGIASQLALTLPIVS